MRVALLVFVFGACGRIGFDALPPERTVVELDEFETASPTFVRVDELVIPPSTGRWIVVATATLQSTSLDAEYGAELRYTIDGVERGVGGTQTAALDRPGPFQHFVVVDGTAAEQIVTFELRDVSEGTARVEQLRAYALPLGDGAFYAAADDILELATLTYLPAVGFEPTVPGEYLWFGLVNASDAPGRSDCYTRWTGANGLPVARSLHMPRAAWQSHLVIWRETVAQGAKITLEVQTSNEGGRIRYARLLGIPTADIAFAFSSKEAVVTTTTEALVHELAPQLAGDRFLRVASTRLDSDCDVTSPQADREVIFEGGAPSAIRHAIDNCSYQSTYGVFEMLDALPSKLKTTIRSGNGGVVNASDSTLLLIAVPEN